MRGPWTRVHSLGSSLNAPLLQPPGPQMRGSPSPNDFEPPGFVSARRAGRSRRARRCPRLLLRAGAAAGASTRLRIRARPLATARPALWSRCPSVQSSLLESVLLPVPLRGPWPRHLPPGTQERPALCPAPPSLPASGLDPPGTAPRVSGFGSSSDFLDLLILLS